MIKDILFQPLAEEYLNQVLEIESNSFPKPWTRQMFEREISLAISEFYVALSDKKVLAYGGYWHVGDEAHIVNIAVAGAYRGHGLGKKMLDYMIETMRQFEIKKILLEARRSNIAAIKLYENGGFKISGIRSKYYETEDAILMEKALQRPALTK